VGGKTRTDADGKVTKGWDHDPPAQEKLVPFGILMLATGALMLLFGSAETSDAWVDALQVWWLQVRAGLGHVKRLVIYLDNGPKNSGRRTQFLKRMVQFADWSGLEIRLVYYPPYHSKYNPIERCWSALEQKWNGVLLNCLEVVLQCALRMKWKGQHPTVKRLDGEYPNGVRVAAKEMREYEARLERSATLSKYDIIIKPKTNDPQVS
jgi:transposase